MDCQIAEWKDQGHLQDYLEELARPVLPGHNKVSRIYQSIYRTGTNADAS